MLARLQTVPRFTDLKPERENSAHIPPSNKAVCVGSVLLPSVIFQDSQLYRRRFSWKRAQPLGCSGALLLLHLQLRLHSWLILLACRAAAAHVYCVKAQKMGGSIRKITSYTPNSDDERVSANRVIIHITVGSSSHKTANSTTRNALFSLPSDTKWMTTVNFVCRFSGAWIQR